MIPPGHIILIVDDNEDDRFMLKRAMTAAGLRHLVREVEDGEQAVNYFKGIAPFEDRVGSPPPVLVLLDLKMPKLHGHDVLAWIRQQAAWCGVVVIVFTSSKEPADIGRAYELGANAYLIKPSSLTELVESTRAIDAFWLQRNQFSLRNPPLPDSTP
jgi:DNA-binding response OmpR family regulator